MKLWMEPAVVCRALAEARTASVSLTPYASQPLFRLSLYLILVRTSQQKKSWLGHFTVYQQTRWRTFRKLQAMLRKSSSINVISNAKMSDGQSQLIGNTEKGERRKRKNITFAVWTWNFKNIQEYLLGHRDAWYRFLGPFAGQQARKADNLSFGMKWLQLGSGG